MIVFSTEMIVKNDGYITLNWTDTRHKVEYQFSKLLSEKGTIIFSDCEDFTAGGLYEFYKERAELYNQVSRYKEVKNIAKCFIVSMPPGEYPDQETFAKIGDRLLEKLGYSESPRIMFQHHDTDKAHMHIIVSTITDNMTHIDNDDDYQKSYQAGRELEKEFGYSELKKKLFKKESFQEIATRRYYFQNALQKGIRQDKTGEFTNLFSDEIQQRILRQALSNEMMVELLGEDLYDRVGELLKSKNLFFKNFKGELVERLETLYNHCSGEEFLKYAKENGIYCRHVKNTLVYGLPDLSFYINENSLPRKFHYKSLKENQTTFKLESEQEQYIFESFCNSCYGTPEAFLQRLNQHKILAFDPEGNLLALSKNMNYNFGQYTFMDATYPDAQRISGKLLSKKLSDIKMKEILENKYAHQYRLSEDFKEPIKAQDDMFCKTLKKAMKSHAVRDRLNELIPNDMKEYLKSYASDKNSCRILMNENTFLAVSDILYKGGFYHSHYLDQLKSDLDKLYDQAQGDRTRFFIYAEKEGINIRLLKNDTLIYEIGREEGKFRYKENRLPQKYRNSVLVNTDARPAYKFQSEQYHYLFESIQDSFKDKIVLKDVFRDLSRHQIEVYDRNQRPLNEKNGSEVFFGDCLFADRSSVNPVFIPGSALSKTLSKQTLSEAVSRKMSDDHIREHFSSNNYPNVYGFIPVHSHISPEDEQFTRKKKKRGIGDININD